ncbi:Metal-sulfur cluster biosynthetic enzyme (PaaD) (PDB:1UWD) [Commensalibacter papalotli (ex Botero et al. 2024)]|uniref:Metal-sulfur cluster biosynthetic enzyme n=3 Tax=Acetobacteraceae TaxID=433 RepID=W7E6B5_9PROT|nr:MULTISPECIES: SUF system Fe-S cluster assembly protein [Commensalibacter]EUK18636.1 metal-sulfur cluster biosynthetic enzyme [Commensalibacter papalotli (ex Servin-Garciduenas et al. 2014)]CAI3930319.1 Metal-sulfur cluster biosynthetic enzyme (PaaD) (PDB:1UWD) [Commensalibacter papalotli (ex Botero et al. 2024)]CAI3945315.1 Metal-sulfur cluster biosynthetic enzyme (PaaD) (PDB:1UWD) [Commensalibacter papalotli (ex Botero et al. 2024)]
MENNSITSTNLQEVDSLSENMQPNTNQAEPQSVVEVWTPEDTQVNSENTTTESGEINENAVIDAISTVYDPEIPVNVYELGLIYAVDLHDDGRVNVEMTLTAPNCPSAQELPIMIQQAIEKVAGVTQVQVEVVWDPPWDISRMSDEARLTLNMF